jgi:phenylacetate-CoA ligase
MNFSTPEERRKLESLDARALASHQLRRFEKLLEAILPHNAFYAAKLSGISRPIRSLDAFAGLPFSYKEELIGAGHGHDLAKNRTWPLERYARFHQTSGTHGRPMVVVDTAEDWQWWIGCWQYVLDAAEVAAGDRALMAFSFGPFIGFWSAYDALAQRGCLVVPTGGVNTLGRLELARASKATVVCCTPSYALHLAEIGAKHKLDVGSLGVRRLILAGEPGGSVPAVRSQIESLWKAKVLDHCGATEVGPWGFGDLTGDFVRVIESEFIAEFLSVATGTSAAEGELSELVITSLGRAGSPVIRYRTGDLVRPTWRSEKVSGTVSPTAGQPRGKDNETVPDAFSENRFVRLEGGVIGRTDDMLIVRGVNVFPSSIEQIVRSFPEVVEFRATIDRDSQLDRLTIEIEDRLEQPERVARELQLRLGLSVEVRSAPLGSLPRFEGKGKRFVDRRKKNE